MLRGGDGNRTGPNDTRPRAVPRSHACRPVPDPAPTAATLLADLRRRGVADDRVLAALGRVPRDRFVPEALRPHAWEDRALPIGGGQTISQPTIVAQMTAALELTGSETVLDVGTGSGYQAAVLAELLRGGGGRVVTVERVPALADSAKNLLEELGDGDAIDFRLGDATAVLPADERYDGILVAAAAPEVPTPLYDRLAIGGRLVVPVGGEWSQTLTVVRRTTDGPETRSLGACRFVKLIGEAGWPR